MKTDNHPLIGRDVRPPRNWNEWLERWHAAGTYNEMLGLLHTGFNISFGRYSLEETEYTHIDQLLFYFGLAEGWKHGLYSPMDNQEMFLVGYNARGGEIKKSSSDLRQDLAKKAFEMLCLNFFAANFRDENREKWLLAMYWRDVFSDKLFPTILRFFRADPLDSSIDNLSKSWEKPSNNEKQAIAFLLDLMCYMWEWEETETDSYFEGERKEEMKKENARIRNHVENGKLLMMDILVFLDRLDLLDKHMLDLSDACLAKLTEIAMRAEIQNHFLLGNKAKPVENLQEACYVGSSVAKFLLIREVRKKIHNTLKAMEAAKRKIKDAETELQETVAAIG